MLYYTESLLKDDTETSAIGTANLPSTLRERDATNAFNSQLNIQPNNSSIKDLPKTNSNMSMDDENDDAITFSSSPAPSPIKTIPKDETEDERLAREIREEAQQLAEERRKREEEERQKREEMRAKRAAQPKKPATTTRPTAAVATENLSEKQLLARQKREQQRLEMLKWKQEQMSSKKVGNDEPQDASAAEEPPASTPAPTPVVASPAPVPTPVPKTPPQATAPVNVPAPKTPPQSTPATNTISSEQPAAPTQPVVAATTSPAAKQPLLPETTQIKPMTFALSPEVPRARSALNDATTSTLTELSNKTKTLLSSPLNTATKPLSFDASPLRISERLTNAIGANSGSDAQQRELEKAKEEALVLAMEYNELQQKYAAEVKQREQFQSVLMEYENTISALIQQQNQAKEQENAVRQKLAEENEILKKNNEKLTQEHTKLDQLFSALKLRHDELKQANDAAQSNEQALKEKITQLQQTVATTENQYKALKTQAETKLEAANQQILKLSQAAQTQAVGASNSKDAVVAKAKLQKVEARMKFLEGSFAAKVQENVELHSLCEELINLLSASRS
eukprot:TRINITY_DN10963_c0_g1_i1.p1 TRINITY_DN10963_c0_g1~~TRINITY_DN10963_c0_g1_i1.p1  ORF type:complete len:569 (-),score=202.50 TRINITY_DN10963_c0_g1_i1:149-1855(-)